MNKGDTYGKYSFLKWLISMLMMLVGAAILLYECSQGNVIAIVIVSFFVVLCVLFVGGYTFYIVGKLQINMIEKYSAINSQENMAMVQTAGHLAKSMKSYSDLQRKQLTDGNNSVDTSLVVEGDFELMSPQLEENKLITE